MCVCERDMLRVVAHGNLNVASVADIGKGSDQICNRNRARAKLSPNGWRVGRALAVKHAAGYRRPRRVEPMRRAVAGRRA